MNGETKELPIIERDPWLKPCGYEIVARRQRYLSALAAIERNSGSLADYANGHLYFGFNRDEDRKGWWFREWLPGARDVYLFGDFNNWNRSELLLSRVANGVWELFLPDSKYGDSLTHGSLVKILVHGDNGSRERIPAYIRRVVQDESSKDFTGQHWQMQPFDWSGDAFDMRSIESLLIYECHIGMAQERPAVGTYKEFEDHILPRIKAQGYNTIQLMGVAEHPYYGSFGYHVSNFFAPSSRFGTPEELKSLIRTAHSMGIGVVMDLVHAHYVKNINEGLNGLDGTDHLYSKAGQEGYQEYWDSMTFDYGKEEVRHFLLSNLKYWLEEFRFDGFRFDGVTSMIYNHHGYTEFDSRDKFFGPDIDNDALTYLTLANHLTHELRPDAITIAEDVSGMPGMAVSIDDGGVGFDYRLGMAMPDFWIKMLKEVPDEQWDIWSIWKIMTDRMPGVKTVAYAESHDQALVGDMTIAFRLMGAEMYWNMERHSQSVVVERGIALHKMIRLLTITLGGQAYLNFMGNEFGHPEWIDFPRQGNDWSYEHARRIWSISTDTKLRYSELMAFDLAMINFVKDNHILLNDYAYNRQMDEANKTMAYSHGNTLLLFNWHPDRSIADYRVPVPGPGRYEVVLSSDEVRFGGQGRVDTSTIHFSAPQSNSNSDGQTDHFIRVYNISRAALVLKRVDE